MRLSSCRTARLRSRGRPLGEVRVTGGGDDVAVCAEVVVGSLEDGVEDFLLLLEVHITIKLNFQRGYVYAKNILSLSFVVVEDVFEQVIEVVAGPPPGTAHWELLVLGDLVVLLFPLDLSGEDAHCFFRTELEEEDLVLLFWVGGGEGYDFGGDLVDEGQSVEVGVGDDGVEELGGVFGGEDLNEGRQVVLVGSQLGEYPAESVVEVEDAELVVG